MCGKDGFGCAPLLADLRRRQPPRLHEILSFALVGSDEFSDRPESPPEFQRISNAGMAPPILNSRMLTFFRK
jgi:hypothetical protein